MFKDWYNIATSKEFLGYGPDERDAIRRQWFMENVANTPEFNEYGEPDQNDIFKQFNQESRSVEIETGGQDRSFGDFAKDTGIALAKGVQAIPETVVGLYDLVSGGRVGKTVEESGINFKRSREELDKNLSDAQKLANMKVANADGVLGTLSESIKNPSTIWQAAVESAPGMVAGGLAGRVIAGSGVLGRGLSETAKRSAAIRGAALGEGLITTGTGAEQIRQDTGLLSPQQALTQVAAGVGTTAISLAGGRIAEKLGFADPDTLLAGAGIKKTEQGIIKRIIGGGISEGVFEELPQSVQEQVWQNAALDKPLTEGIEQSAVQGMLVGGLMGGGANIAARNSAIEDIKSAPTTDAAIDAFSRATKPDLPKSTPATELKLPTEQPQEGGQNFTQGPLNVEVGNERIQTAEDRQRIINETFTLPGTQEKISERGGDSQFLSVPGQGLTRAERVAQKKATPGDLQPGFSADAQIGKAENAGEQTGQAPRPFPVQENSVAQEKRKESTNAKEMQEQEGREGSVKQPWEMTKEEWDQERDKIRPETFGSSPAKAPITAEVARTKRLEELLYGVTDEASAKIKAAAKGEINLTQEEVRNYDERLNTKVSHYDVIKKALSENRPVPERVLSQYPDLAQKQPQINAQPTESNTIGAIDIDGETKPIVSRYEIQSGEYKGKSRVTLEDGSKQVVPAESVRMFEPEWQTPKTEPIGTAQLPTKTVPIIAQTDMADGKVKVTLENGGKKVVSKDKVELAQGVETKRDKALREYNDYISTLSDDQKIKVADLIEATPQSPGLQKVKIAKALSSKQQTMPQTGVSEQRSVDKNRESQVKRLRNVAANLKAKGEEKYNQDRNTNTARRARMAASATESAAKDIQIAETMQKIADGIESGDVKALQNVSTKTHVEFLDSELTAAKRAYFKSKNYSYSEEKQHWDDPLPSNISDFATYRGITVYDIREIRNALEDKRGGKKLFSDVHGNNLTLKKAREIQSFVNKHGIRNIPYWHQIEDGVKRASRMSAMGIKHAGDLQDAIKEYADIRSGRRKEDPIKAKERELVTFKGNDFFPTPKPVISRMVEEAGIEPGMRVLEPSAGKGDIADTIKEESGVTPDVVEVSSTLSDFLKLKGYETVGTDFLEFKNGGYDRIVMNPPFSKNQDIKHVLHAFSMLNPGGRIVAITSEHPFFASDKESVAFREFVDGNGWSEKLPEGSFKGKDSFKQTGVNSRLVVLDKPEGKTKLKVDDTLDKSKKPDNKNLMTSDKGPGDKITTDSNPSTPEGGKYQELRKQLSELSKDDFDKTGLQVGSNLKETLTRVVYAEDDYRLTNLREHLPPDRQTAVIKSNSPTVKIYRGSKGEYSKIRPGDWVAVSKTYAKLHTVGRKNSTILELEVPREDVVWAGTDENEFFYAPKDLSNPTAPTTYEGITNALNKIPNPPSQPGDTTTNEQPQKPEGGNPFKDSVVQDVVYHGTKSNIENFSRDFLGTNTNAESAKKGFFFTNSMDVADKYAQMAAPQSLVEWELKNIQRREQIDEELDRLDDLQTEAFNSGNEAEYDRLDDEIDQLRAEWDQITKEWIDRQHEELRKEGGSTGKNWKRMVIGDIETGKKIYSAFLDIRNPKTIQQQGKRDISFSREIDIAIKHGYDGLIIKDVNDPIPGDVYIVFEPSQIKIIPNPPSQPGKADKTYLRTDTPTADTIRNLKKITPYFERAIREAGLGSVADRIALELKEEIDISGKNIGETKSNWAAKGVDIASTRRLGATTINKAQATVEISLNQNWDRTRHTINHEFLHVVAEWLLPVKTYNALMKFYDGNEETAADAFADYMIKRETENPPKGLARRAMAYLKRVITNLGNMLRGKGFTSPSDIFGGIAGGKYSIQPGLEVSTSLKTGGKYDQIADSFNQEYPGHSVTYDGEMDLSMLNRDNLYQFTARDGAIRGATFTTKEPTVSAIKEGMDRMLEMRGVTRLAVDDIESNVPTLMNRVKAIISNRRPDRARNKADLSAVELAIKSPQFYNEDVKQARRLYERNQQRQTDKETIIDHMERHDGENVVDSWATLKKESPEQFKRSSDYLIEADQTGSGFNLRLENGFWQVVDPKGKAISQYESKMNYSDLTDSGEQQALYERHRLENEYLKREGYTDQERAAIISFRIATDKGFDLLIRNLRELQAKANDIKIDVDGKMVSIAEAIATMNEKRGTYFPRIHEKGRYVLYARKEGKPTQRESHSFRWQYNNSRAKWEAKGYKVTVTEPSNVGEDIFELEGSTLKTEQLVNAALARMQGKESLDADTMALFSSALGEQIANIIRQRGARGFMTKRSKELYVGYETNPTLAIAKYIRSLAGAEAKRMYVTDAMAIISGTDITADEFQQARDYEGNYDDWELEGINPKIDRDTFEKINITDNPLREEIETTQEAFEAETDKEKKDKLREHLLELDSDIYHSYGDMVKDRMIDETQQKRTWKWSKAYIEETTRNPERADEIIGKIRSVAIFKYLATRFVSAPLVNVTAMPTAVVATMKASGISYKDSWKYLGKGINTTRKYWSGSKLSNDESWIIEHIKKSGWDNAQFTSEALVQLRGAYGRAYDYILDKGMYTFKKSEELNRISTISGAFLALKKQNPTMSNEDLAAKAKKISDDSHGVYNKGNLPYLALGGNPAAQVARMFYVFRTFSHTYLQNMARIGFKDKTALAHMILAPAVLAGAGASVATPILQAALKAFNIGGDDPEEEFYKYMYDHLGPSGERFARHGVTGLANINIKGSLAIGITDIPTNIEDILGAPYSVVKDVYYGGKSLLRGDISKGVEKLTPYGVSNILRAYRESTEGVTNKNNAPIFYGKEQLKPTAYESLLRAMSLNPARIAGVTEKQWRESTITTDYSERKTDIYAKIKRFYSLPPNKRTNEKWIPILEEIEKFNSDSKRYNYIPQITNKSIKTMLKRAFKPSKKERLREEAA